MMMKWLVGSLAVVSTLAAGQTPGALDPSQTYTTPNLVLPTVSGSNQSPWVNGVYQNSLTCFAWGDPGYCGPNAITTPGYNINFSFGMTNIYQVRAIADMLPNSGTGLRVNGYNFGFLAKNGNGWDNGQQDYLTAYVNFFDPANKSVFYKSYDLNSKFNWTPFNYSETFNTPFASKDLNTVQYGFIGMDTNYWAGPYGPEITNINFSLKYSVDPCYNNVLYSPTCPGYMDALAKLAPQPTLTADPVSTASTNTIMEPTNASTPPANTTSNSGFVSSTNLITNTTVDPVSATTTSSTTQLVSVPKTTDGTSIGLSVVAKNQQREQAIAMQAAQSAVEQANQAGQQAQQNALDIAQASSLGSVINPNNPTNRQNGLTQQRQDSTLSQSSTLSQQLALFALPSNTQQNTYKPVEGYKSSVTSNNQDVFGNQVSISSISVQSSAETQIMYTLLPPQQLQQNFNQPVATVTAQSNQLIFNGAQPVNNITNEQSTNDNQKMLLDRSNPLFQALDAKPMENQNNTTFTQGPVVNRNAQNNEVAGGVDLTRMAQAPSGYNDYMNLVLRDAAFYVPKEVYKNQKVVDNARALRSLSSDRLHQELVEQQYRR